MPRPTTVVVLLAALTVTGAGFYATRGHADAVESHRLDEEAQLGVAAFNAFAQDVESTIARGGAVAAATGGDAVAFDTAFASRTRLTTVSSLALLRMGEDSFETEAEVGRREAPLPRRFPARFSRRIEQIASTQGLDLADVAELEEGRAIGLAARAEDGPYVVYAEVLLPPAFSLTEETANGNAVYALYLGEEADGSLIVSNAEMLPIEGRRVTRRLRLGAQRPLLVLSTRDRLSGTFTRILPWGVLGAGIAFSLLVALLVEAGRRRRDRARSLAADLEHTSAELDSSEAR